MPTLPQLIAQANKASYFSRDADEVLAAVSNAARKIYFAVLKEYKGGFRKVDTTTIAIVANQDTYKLPADFSELEQLAERSVSTEPWYPMRPASLNSTGFVAAQLESTGIPGDGPQSQFQYVGPYLDGAGAEAGQESWYVQFAPMPQQARSVRITYNATFIPIVSPGSVLMIPDEGTEAVKAYAIAELLRLNGDQLAETFEAEGQKAESRFLTWYRDRQTQDQSAQEPYLTDWD